MKKIVVLILLFVVLISCANEPAPAPTPETIVQEVPVTVEVTRVVTEQVTVEVPVEVTRVIEVLVTETAVSPTEVPAEEPTPTAEPTATPLADGELYTVVDGDNLSIIASKTQTDIGLIREANGLTNQSLLSVGQQLIIPGWDGVVAEIAVPTAPPVAANPNPAPPAGTQPVGANLLPNPSFEGDWYFFQFNELQIPDGWQLITDEGPNNLEPGAGGLFNRPEVRVVPSQDLPPAERPLFIFEGNKTVKAFKGGAPTSFSLFTDVPLQPGNYRLTIRFYPDTVAVYNGGQKTFATDPLAAEARIIVDNGGTGWQGTQAGQRNVITFDFNVDSARTVRVGGSFRNRFVMGNNGWFIDDWSLQRLDG